MKNSVSLYNAKLSQKLVIVSSIFWRRIKGRIIRFFGKCNLTLPFKLFPFPFSLIEYCFFFLSYNSVGFELFRAILVGVVKTGKKCTKDFYGCILKNKKYIFSDSPFCRASCLPCQLLTQRLTALTISQLIIIIAEIIDHH